jgi:hypothetical protein
MKTQLANCQLPTHSSLTPEGQIERAAMIARNAASTHNPAYDLPPRSTDWPKWVSRFSKAQRWVIAGTLVGADLVAVMANDAASGPRAVSTAGIVLAPFFVIIAPIRRRKLKLERRH